MSTVQEIEAAIKALPSTEREKLVEDLPVILPELNGDAVWERIMADPRPRPDLSKRFDEIEAGYAKHPESFAEMHDADFDRQQ